jgi:hypothetical protein
MPTKAEFLAAPVETVAVVAPRSMVYAPGGTRRSAAFAGIEPWSAEYLRVGQDKYIECLEVIFRYGVEHAFTPAVMVGHANEVEDIEGQLIVPLARFVTNGRLLDACRQHGWRVRIASSAYREVLKPYMDILEEKTPANATHTWWMTFTPSYESWWSTLIALAKSEQVSTRSEAIRVMYGEEIPPITLCISFGKLMVSPDLFPPLLMDNVQCYWSQQAGSSLTDQQFRKILYDYAYLRQTWRKDKSARAKEARAEQETWEQEMIIGLGKRLGPFWYPDLPQSPLL